MGGGHSQTQHQETAAHIWSDQINCPFMDSCSTLCIFCNVTLLIRLHLRPSEFPFWGIMKLNTCHVIEFMQLNALHSCAPPASISCCLPTVKNFNRTDSFRSPVQFWISMRKNSLSINSPTVRRNFQNIQEVLFRFMVSDCRPGPCGTAFTLAADPSASGIYTHIYDVMWAAGIPGHMVTSSVMNRAEIFIHRFKTFEPDPQGAPQMAVWFIYILSYILYYTVSRIWIR